MSDTTQAEKSVAALNSLHPVFRQKVEVLLQQMLGKGWQPVIVYGTRTEAQQEKLIKEGVGGKKSWHVPSTMGLLRGPAANSITIVRGAAADIVDRRWGWHGPCADKDYDYWEDLGATAKALGLEWGGDWAKRDVAHVQMKIIEQAPQTSLVT